MALFNSEKPLVISDEGLADLSRARLSENLSAVDFNTEDDFFYVTVDRVIFSNPVATIRTFLEAHGYVPNLENILSCLDSFTFAIHAQVTDKPSAESQASIREYIPCVRLELPKKHKVGPVLQSFYDELSKYDPGLLNAARKGSGDGDKAKSLRKENEALKERVKELKEQVGLLTQQLAREQKSLSRASRALDSQRILPDNALIGKVEHVDLRRRTVTIKVTRQNFDLPTQMLDRVPGLGARCLITMDDANDVPIDVLFFDRAELTDLEYRVAEVLYVQGDTFKARDSLRNEFQIKALNELEAGVVRALHRGDQVVLKVSDDHVIHFSRLDAIQQSQFQDRVQEHILLFGMGRNALVDTNPADAGLTPQTGGNT